MNTDDKTLQPPKNPEGEMAENKTQEEAATTMADNPSPADEKPAAQPAAQTSEDATVATAADATDANVATATSGESTKPQTSAADDAPPPPPPEDEKAGEAKNDTPPTPSQVASESTSEKDEVAIDASVNASADATVADDKPAAKDETAKEAKDEKRGGGPRRVSGIVVGDKADKTARVRIERRVTHALYGKVIRRRTHLQAHDAENQCRIGDMVTLEESPRFSKTKSWRVIAITPGDGR